MFFFCICSIHFMEGKYVCIESYMESHTEGIELLPFACLVKHTLPLEKDRFIGAGLITPCGPLVLLLFFLCSPPHRLDELA